MKHASIIVLTFALIVLLGCAHGGRPLPPEEQAILDSMPDPLPGEKDWLRVYNPNVEKHLPDAAKSSSGDQINTITDNKGNYLGQVRQEGSTGLWSIYNTRGDYVGRIDQDGVITNQRGDYVGRIK